MSKQILFNVEIQESYGLNRELLEHADAASIGYGITGDEWEFSKRAIELCTELELAIGLRASYPNHPEKEQSVEEIKHAWPRMLGLCRRFFDAAPRAAFVHPEAAFYNQSAHWNQRSEEDPNFVACVTLVGILQRAHLPLVGLARSRHLYAADSAKSLLLRELRISANESGENIQTLEALSSDPVYFAERYDVLTFCELDNHSAEKVAKIREQLIEAFFRFGFLTEQVKAS